eukprot:scaffold44138_cov55-Attheya_sp.AAC.3
MTPTESSVTSLHDGTPAKKTKLSPAENESRASFVTPSVSESFSQCPEDGANLSCDLGKEDHRAESRRNSGPSTLSKTEVKDLMLTETGYNVDDPKNMKKRKDYLAWDDYFMAIAFLSAQRSKDPNVQVGACIVDKENRITGIGYNGFPRGCPDDCLPWGTNSSSMQEDGNTTTPYLHTKDAYMCHAEVNAILNKRSADVTGARMYAGNECAKIIIQSRIEEIIYVEDNQPDADTYRASRLMFKMSGVKTRRYTPSSDIEIDFPPEDDAMTKSNSPTESERLRNSELDKGEKKEDFRSLLKEEANYDPVTTPSGKRMGALSWDTYFIAVSFLSAMRSKDPNTQVGACIVDSNKCIVGIGYNGFPRGCSDDALPWSREGASDLHTKYCYVCHAEVNAVLNKCSADLKGATIYVALFPCNECAKVIIQSGIREVVYLSDKYHDSNLCRASRVMFRMAGVELRQYSPCEKTVHIKFSSN